MTVRQDRMPRTRADEERNEPAPAQPLPQSAAQLLALQRNAGNAAVGRLLQRFMVDYHGQAQQPGAGQAVRIQEEMNPSSPHQGTTAAWDGDKSNGNWMINRAMLQAKLFRALIARMDRVMPEIRARALGPSIPIASFEGAGRAAKRVVDEKFGGLTSAAVLTQAQQHTRATFSFEAGRNLIDARDPRYRTPDPAFIAEWMARTDPAAQKATAEHGFDYDRSREERDWLDDALVQPFTQSRRADLVTYEIYGFAQTPLPSAVFITPAIHQPGFSEAAPAAGGPSPAERRARWEAWQLLVHEYIHTLEHPTFERARQRNDVLKEGFCEMFTEEVLREWIPKAKADKDPALRALIEGSDPKGKPWPGFTPDLVSDYDPGDYAEFVKHAKKIREILGDGGEGGVKGAFFQGHVEFLGLTPTGTAMPGRTTVNGEVDVPAGVTTWSDLSALTGVPVMELAGENPVVAEPLTAGRPIRAPGTRHHIVVAAEGRGERAVESADQIAMQVGVTTAALQRANRGVDFSKLKAGDMLLIPRR